MGSQMSKTDGVLLNLIGWKLDDDPAPVLYIGPTQKNVESIAGSASGQNAKGRVGQMIRQCRRLWDGLAKGKDEKITEKWINGVRLGFGWAGSATELASHPAALGLLDEYDRMAPIAGEGDALGLLQARTSTYPDATVVVCSTALEGTLEESIHPETGLSHWDRVDPDDLGSPTWSLWQDSTAHEWAWPCPDCRQYFIPRGSLLWYPEDATPAQALKHARMVCPHCGSQIEDARKEAMNEAGRAVAPGQSVTVDGEVIGEEPDNSTFGLWVSGLCSPWRSFGQRAKALVAAKISGDPEKERVAYNTGLGELWAPKGEAPPWSEVKAHAMAYEQGTAPDDIKLLTAGVDVQKDRLVYVIRGWGMGMSSALIDHGELWGDTEGKTPGGQDPWFLLEQTLLQSFNGLYVLRAAVDSGYLKDKVYEFCRKHPTQAVPTKGQDTAARSFWASRQDLDIDGKVIKDGIVLWNINTDWAKSWVHGRLQEGWKPGQPGYWALPKNISDDYCRQIIAEQRVMQSRKIKWVRRSKINHYLDCEAYAFFAAMSIGADKELMIMQQSSQQEPNNQGSRKQRLKIRGN